MVIFGLTTAVTDDGGVASVMSLLDAIEGFRQGSNLVHLDQDAVSQSLLRCLDQSGLIRHE